MGGDVVRAGQAVRRERSAGGTEQVQPDVLAVPSFGQVNGLNPSRV